MHTDTFERLRALNHEFYQTFAGPFADKRQRLQPGILSALEKYLPAGKILDLGCGHGALAQHLIETGFQGTYLGLDLSEGMIAQAQHSVEHPQVRFVEGDLSLNAWVDVFQSVDRAFSPPYAMVLAFASLHHIPGTDRRENLVQEVANALESRGLWILSVWDFMQSNRLRKRILPWESVGVDPALVEPGDHLIDWRHGGQGVRYVHHFSPEELAGLAMNSGFEVVETFQSDGENGLQGLYQVWEKR